MTIRKEGMSYVVRSESTGRNLGRYRYTTKKGKELALKKARDRLRQIEFFKHRDIKVRKHRRKGKRVRAHRRRIR